MSHVLILSSLRQVKCTMGVTHFAQADLSIRKQPFQMRHLERIADILLMRDECWKREKVRATAPVTIPHEEGGPFNINVDYIVFFNSDVDMGYSHEATLEILDLSSRHD